MSAKKKPLPANAGANTLFNYFSKSPAATSNKRALTDSPGTPISAKKPKPDLDVKKDDSASESSPDISVRHDLKRRRIAIVDSDSDYNPASDTEKENTKSDSNEKKNKKAASSKQPESKKKLDFEKKLQVKSESEQQNKSVINIKDQKDNDANDEPITWLHQKLEFLKPEFIKDKNRRRPNHNEYDKTTLYVPDEYLKSLTPAMRQWWILKSNNFDAILFFKVGKFYELYHMDAEVGVTELGFSFMRGEFAHSGFPEQAYDRMVTGLIERGYKVARVEQTETPDRMTERVKKMQNATKFDKVVSREICQVTNKGTQVFSQQVRVTVDHQPNYLMAICEKIVGQQITYGVCFIDTSIGVFHIGEFTDDQQCSRLLTLLAHYPPVLILLEKNGVSSRTNQVLKSSVQNVLKEYLLNETQFWNADKTLLTLVERYYTTDGNVAWPQVIKGMLDIGDHLGLTPANEYVNAIRSFGACIWYLTKCVIDRKVIDIAQYSHYVPLDEIQSVKPSETMKTSNSFLILDSITLNNLKIVGSEGSLLHTIDYCCTKFGKRLLHQWVCAPSCSIKEISGRQKAISELLTNGEMLQETRAILAKLPDLERLLALIHAFGNIHCYKDHPDGRAVLFEQKSYNKKKIQDFISTLEGFELAMKIPSMFSDYMSEFIKKISQHHPIGQFPNLTEHLNFFKDAFNHKAALEEGTIAPEDGVDQEYDDIVAEIQSIKAELEAYRKKQEKYFGCRVEYFGTDKKRFQLEVPESNARKASSDYTLEGQKKGTKPAKRYHTKETKDFLKKMQNAEERRNEVLNDLSRRIFEKFSSHYTEWKTCVDLVAIIDVLCSLAEFSRNLNHMCIPELVDSDKPIIEIEDGYHPCMAANEDYIPNSIALGEKISPLSILTGPNMGGKSTLMRQIGLLIVLAQMGSPVPAEKCKFSPVDRIFTRLGAHDDIIAGQSTFLVELSETSAILKHATVNSLILLDELGRGTATYDGTAIAVSVVNYLADLKCRVLFSTHYHNLVDNFHNDPRVTMGHMACMVENEENDDPTKETVTFLYKYSDGPCPKSYGFNAAKLAGMPFKIIKRAYELSKLVEGNAIRRRLITHILRNDKTKDELTELITKIKECRF